MNGHFEVVFLFSWFYFISVHYNRVTDKSVTWEAKKVQRASDEGMTEGVILHCLVCIFVNNLDWLEDRVFFRVVCFDEIIVRVEIGT